MNNKLLEVLIVVLGGAIGGLVSVMETWTDPSSSPLSLLKVYALVVIPFFKGGVAAGIGVYVLTTLDSNHMARAFFFAVACGLVFPSILTKSGNLADSVTSKVSQYSINENVLAIRETIEKADTDGVVDVAKLKDASEKIILAEGKVEGSVETGAELAINDAIATLGMEATAGDENAVKAISDIGEISSMMKSMRSKFVAIKELQNIENTPGIDDKIRSEAKLAVDALKRNHEMY